MYDPLVKADLTLLTAGGGAIATIALEANDWAHEFAPLITLALGLLSLGLALAGLIYKVWATKADNHHRERERALEHKKIEFEKMKRRWDDDHED